MYLGSTSSQADEQTRLRAQTPLFDTPKKLIPRKEEAVYFNSNRFLGERYLTPDAAQAGYTLGVNDIPSPGESLVDFTEKRLFERDADQMILQAESRLLHALSKFPQARNAMRTVYSASTFSPSNMKWTSEEREWLFLCLTGSPVINPPLPMELLDGGTPLQLYSHLSNREDCPNGAFGVLKSSWISGERKPLVRVIDSEVEASVNQQLDGDTTTATIISNFDPDEQATYEETDLDPVSSSSVSVEVEPAQSDWTEEGEENDSSDTIKGMLDEYFLDADDLFPSFNQNKIATETRAELTVQETVATLLRATATKRFATAKAKFSSVVNEMDRRVNEETVDTQQRPQSPKDGDFADLSSEELQDLFEILGTEVMEAQKSLYESDRSTDRVNAHLLDYSVSNGVQYKLSQAELERLDKLMEDHIANLPEDAHRPETWDGDGLYVFGEDEESDGVDAQFGGRDPDEFIPEGCLMERPSGLESTKQRM